MTEQNYDELKKADLQAELGKRKIEFDSRATNEDLVKLLKKDDRARAKAEAEGNESGEGEGNEIGEQGESSLNESQTGFEEEETVDPTSEDEGQTAADTPEPFAGEEAAAEYEAKREDDDYERGLTREGVRDAQARTPSDAKEIAAARKQGGPIHGTGVQALAEPAPAHAPGQGEAPHRHVADYRGRNKPAPAAPTRFDGRDTGDFQE